MKASKSNLQATVDVWIMSNFLFLGEFVPVIIIAGHGHVVKLASM
jgi:hypothetical protein